MALLPPACRKLLETEMTHTHTRPLCGGLAQNLDRRLKSLRNKRKKTRKSSAKRAGEKDWGSKK